MNLNSALLPESCFAKLDGQSGLALDNFGSYRCGASSLELPEIPPVSNGGSLLLPDLKGPYAVGTRTYSFTDWKRPEIFTADPTDYRRVTVQLWYPSDFTTGETLAPYLDDRIIQGYVADFSDLAPAEVITQALRSIQTQAFQNTSLSEQNCTYPVILFSPGGLEIPEFYSNQASQLASQGYVVGTLSSPYESRYTVFSDQPQAVRVDPELLANFTSLDPETNLATAATILSVRTADLSFVLDQLEVLNDQQDWLDGRLDLSRVGVYGHSLGGAAAAEVLRFDDRFVAGLNYDGTLDRETAQLGLDRPFMSLNSNEIGDPTRRSVFQNSRQDSYLLQIAGTGHYNFSDQPLLQATGLPFESIGLIAPELGADIIHDYTIAFFDRYLKDEWQPLLDVETSPYPEVSFEVNPAPNPDPCEWRF